MTTTSSYPGPTTWVSCMGRKVSMVESPLLFSQAPVKGTASYFAPERDNVCSAVAVLLKGPHVTLVELVMT